MGDMQVRRYGEVLIEYKDGKFGQFSEVYVEFLHLFIMLTDDAGEVTLIAKEEVRRISLVTEETKKKKSAKQSEMLSEILSAL